MQQLEITQWIYNPPKMAMSDVVLRRLAADLWSQ